ncbi:MAG: manganese ABC transporter permease [Phycisphaerae bacterium]|nr:MAG: manganese ABC transporter permease [Phycisphaerae bacterium]
MGILMLGVICFATDQAFGQSAPSSHRTITDTRFDWPTWENILRVALLRDHNTRIVVLGTTLLGLAAGLVGTFAYLRRRALMGDALSHATLPGVALAFLFTGEKNLTYLLLGATVTGVLGVLAVLAIRQSSRIREDAAIGIVLSVFFGAGMALMSVVQSTSNGNAAGLNQFIYGKAASMVRGDAWMIGIAAFIVVVGTIAMFKEFRIVCFDQDFAASMGRSVVAIDLLMMGFVVLTTVIGLQAVGLILIVALLIIPAAAARFWTDDLKVMTVLAGGIGAVSGWLGASFSALLPKMPTGAIIVLTAGVLFLLSMVFAFRRGMLAGAFRRIRLRRRIALQHLLRAMAEIEERTGEPTQVDTNDLLTMRSWVMHDLRRLAIRAKGAGFITRKSWAELELTKLGRTHARRVLRNHRLWETYLIEHADIAPSHVDRDADEIEHVLSEELIDELEKALEAGQEIPPSPHDDDGPIASGVKP